MYQLELDLFPYRSKTISEGENQIFSWFDNISETSIKFPTMKVYMSKIKRWILKIGFILKGKIRAN